MSLYNTFNSGVESSVEELSSFQYDNQLGRDLRIIATVKNTFQVDKNNRQVAQLSRKNPEVFGRDKARPLYYGLVAAFSLEHERFTWDLADTEWSFSSLEPYCIDIFNNMLALCGGNYVTIIDLDSGKKRALNHPWLRQAHSVQFTKDGSRILVSSSGFDVVYEFEVATGKTCWEWYAWDNGLDQSRLGDYYVRTRERYEELTAQGHKVVLVDDPSQYAVGIPTRYCPVHINGAYYDHDENVLMTLFQQGAAIRVNKTTGEMTNIVSGLINPHKFHPRRSGGHYVADTRRGMLLLLDDGFEVARQISLKEAPNEVRSTLLSEFLQSVSELEDGLFACIDIHRSTLWLIDVNTQRYRDVKFPREWSIHDVTLNKCSGAAAMSHLGPKVFGRVDSVIETDGSKRISHFSTEGSENATYLLDADGRFAVGEIEI